MGIFARWRNRNMTTEQLAAKIQAVYSDVDKWEGLFATANQVEKLVKNAPKAVREAPEVVLSIFRNKPSDLKSVYYYIRDKEAIDALVAEPDSMHIICGEWGIVHKESYTEDLIQKLMEKDLNAFKKEFTHLDLLTETHAKWLEERGDVDVGCLELNKHVYLATVRMKLKAVGHEIPAERAEMLELARESLSPDEFREFRGILSEVREYWPPEAYLGELEKRLGEAEEGSIGEQQDLQDKIAIQRKSLEKPKRELNLVREEFEVVDADDETKRMTYVIDKSAGSEREFTARELKLIMGDEHLFNSLDEADKFGFAKSLGKYISNELGIECPEIALNATPGLDAIIGGLNFDDRNLIVIAKPTMKDLSMFTSFVAHEIRHEWQKGKEFTYSDGTKTPFRPKGAKASYMATIDVRDGVTKKLNRNFALGYLTTPHEMDARRYAREFCKEQGIELPYGNTNSRAIDCLLRDAARTFVKEGAVAREAAGGIFSGREISPESETYAEMQKNASEFLGSYSSMRGALGSLNGGKDSAAGGEQPKPDVRQHK